MTMGQMRDIPLGCPIFTADGDKLGTVKEVSGAAFKVDAHMQPDYWLPSHCIASSMTDRITVSFDKGHLGDFKAGTPTDIRTPAMTSGIGEAGTGMRRTETYTAAGSGSLSSTGGQTGAATMGGVTGTRGWHDVMPEYRQNWQTRYGSSGQRWQDVEPGYRYGYEMANDPRYRGRQWSDVESDLTTEYPTWSQNQGYPTMMDGWTKSKDSAREAWERVRNGGNGTS